VTPRALFSGLCHRCDRHIQSATAFAGVGAGGSGCTLAAWATCSRRDAPGGKEAKTITPTNATAATAWIVPSNALSATLYSSSVDRTGRSFVRWRGTAGGDRTGDWSARGDPRLGSGDCRLFIADGGAEARMTRYASIGCRDAHGHHGYQQKPQQDRRYRHEAQDQSPSEKRPMSAGCRRKALRSKATPAAQNRPDIRRLSVHSLREVSHGKPPAGFGRDRSTPVSTGDLKQLSCGASNRREAPRGTEPHRGIAPASRTAISRFDTDPSPKLRRTVRPSLYMDATSG
jgi:hypothetical protein